MAVAFGRHTDAIKQREIQVGARRCRRVNDVAARWQAPAPTADQYGGQIFVAVTIAIAESRTVDDHAVIEEGRIAFLHRLELAYVVGEQFGNIEAVYPD